MRQKMIRLEANELVEQMARQPENSKKEFARILAKKWPHLASNIAQYIDVELMDQEAKKGIWSDFAEEGLAKEMEAK
tara:strand:- start:208 stop:438 length:231 start_codon:yes stop_codon:yes gene_type:complete